MALSFLSLSITITHHSAANKAWQTLLFACFLSFTSQILWFVVWLLFQMHNQGTSWILEWIIHLGVWLTLSLMGWGHGSTASFQAFMVCHYKQKNSMKDFSKCACHNEQNYLDCVLSRARCLTLLIVAIITTEILLCPIATSLIAPALSLSLSPLLEQGWTRWHPEVPSLSSSASEGCVGVDAEGASWLLLVLLYLCFANF